MMKFLKPAGFLICWLLFLFLLLDLSFPFRPDQRGSVTVYDRNGHLLNAYLSPDHKWRFPVVPAQADSFLVQAFLNKEDRYFRYHPGFNPFAIARAAFFNVARFRRTSGASTITMQVVRLMEKRPRTVLSKIAEVFRAGQLEFHYSKDDILGMYLSRVPYGGNIEGIKTASWLYFGKPPALLSHAEAVTLTIIPNRPSSLRPNRHGTQQHLVKERNKWLYRFHEEGLLTRADLQQALQEPLVMLRQKLPDEAPHLSRRLAATTQGPDISTTIDLSIQQQATQLCYNHLRRLQYLGIHNGSVLVIENKSGDVLAYVGSQDFHDAGQSGQVDGVRALRSPGSTLKPLVYAMSIDKGLITPKTMLADVPVNYNGYAPENFDLKFNGQVSAEDALSASLNIPAVELLNDLTVPPFRDALIASGCLSIRAQQQLGLSTILGGCGTTLEELCGMYRMFAREGTYSPLRYTTGHIPESTARKIISPSAAFLLSGILTRRDRPDLPHLFDNTVHVPRVAWKTGTSYGRRDAWSIGYNARYTIGVWIGNFDGTGVPELTGADMATPLLFQLFNTIDHRAQGKWFRPTAELDLRYVCPKSGYPPGEHCSEQIIDYFLPGISPVTTCTHLAEYYTDADHRISYCTSCRPETGYRRGLYENPPAEVLRFYREQGFPLELPPPHNPGCTRLFEGRKPVILSLHDGEEYLLEKDDPRPLELSAAVSGDVNTLSWFINDQFYRTVKSDEKIFFVPAKGRSKISCSDDKGRNTDITIMVSYY